MTDESLPKAQLSEQIRSLLSRSETYPEGGPVELCETHISQVFLTPTSAYKRLKPVRFQFLDFSTLEARYIESWNEVRLNRRLAAGIYQNVIPVTRSEGQLQLSGTGSPVDWLINMARLPDGKTLESFIKANTATLKQIDQLLAILIPFFRQASRGPKINNSGKPHIIRQNQVENHFVLSRHFKENSEMAQEVNRLQSAQLQFLVLQQSLFRHRMEEGWIRDGHGDLRAEHLYLTAPPVAVDCVAFNDRLRHADLLDEFCFLATDLKRLGRDDLAEYLLSRYREEMQDPADERLIAFYQSYRSAVRAKVACLRAAEQAEESRTLSEQEAISHLQSAVSILREVHQPILIIFCGLSGSGKSYLAAKLAELLGARHLRSDVVRKQHFAADQKNHPTADALYSKQANAETYELLQDGTQVSLAAGVTTVVDATFRIATDREPFRKLAKQSGVPCLCVEVTCSDEVATRRIADRSAQGTDPSDANVDVRLSQKREFEPPDEFGADFRFQVDGTLSAEENCSQIVSRLGVV
jgi:uncharacterized protein